MRKFFIVLLFILGFVAVFAISGIVTFNMIMGEDSTENVQEESNQMQESEAVKVPVIEGEITEHMSVTTVIPSIKSEDAVIEKGTYVKKPEMPTQSSERQEIKLPNPIAETAKKEEAKSEEVKKEETKKEEPKKEENKKEEIKKEEKATEKATEKTTEKPKENPTEKATEKPKENPTEKATEKPTEKPTEKATEKPTEKPKLDPNIQTSDTGL